MIVTSSSTGKAKIKRSQLQMTECSTCPKVMQKDTHKKDYERPQPIKIAQLLRQPINLRSAQKDSAHKRIQPERLGASTNVKNTKKNAKQNGVDTHGRPANFLKCVRRNLNFNEFPANSLKNNYENNIQSSKLILDEPMNKKCSDPIRKSLLMPPNAIKNKHLQKCTAKVNRYSKIPLMDKKDTVKKEDKKTETVTVLNRNSSIINNSTVLFNNMKPPGDPKIVESSGQLYSKFIDISYVQCFETSHVVSKAQFSPPCTTNQEIPINNENQSLSQNNFPQDKCTSNETNLERGQFIKPEEKSERIQNLCSNLQNTKLVDLENNMNIKHASSEMICINRDKLMSLECEFKNLLTATEENVLKLKLMLTCITKLLSENDENIIQSDTNMKKNCTEPEKPKKIMIDKEVQADTCYNIVQQLGENIRTPIAHTPQITVTNVFSLNTNQNDENDKENYELSRRRMSDGDGSFLELENQLDIKHTKPIQDSISLQKTPVVTRYKQQRSFREYMALKSTMKFLETPDGKRFKPLCQINNIDNSILNTTYISNKLLTDLHNLYSESPES